MSFPPEMVQDIDRMERNRCKLIQEAVQHELQRRRHASLVRSLQNPHPETQELTDLGLEDWATRIPEIPADEILDLRLGVDVSWVPDQGWHEAEE